MSFALTATSLSGAVAGTTGSVDWTQIAQSAGFPDPGSQPHIQFFNESPCELQLNFSTGEQVMLPAGGWQTMALNAQCTRLTYSVLAVLNATPIIAELFGTWYAPGETVPNVAILGNSPIGGSVTNIIAQELLGAGQTYGITTLDSTANPSIVPITKACNLFLDVTDNAGNADTVLGLLNPVAASTVVGAIQFFAPLTFAQDANGQGPGFLQGLGFPAVIGAVVNQQVSGTGAVTLYSDTPTPAALYRVSASALIVNGTSGNNVTLVVTYTDAANNVRTQALPMLPSGGSSFSFMTGSTSIANNMYTGVPLEFSTKAATAITVTYRDPTNTPNDKVSFHLERVA